MSDYGRSRHARYTEYTSGLYRDRERGWLFGVCAGLAERFGWSVFAVRAVALVSLWLLFVPTALAYLAATVLLRERPLIYTGARAERDFWRCGPGSNHRSAS